MRIRLHDPSLLPELRHHFTRSGFTVRELARDTIKARGQTGPALKQAAREVETDLSVWHLTNPGTAFKLDPERD